MCNSCNPTKPSHLPSGQQPQKKKKKKIKVKTTEFPRRQCEQSFLCDDAILYTPFVRRSFVCALVGIFLIKKKIAVKPPTHSPPLVLSPQDFISFYFQATTTMLTRFYRIFVTTRRDVEIPVFQRRVRSVLNFVEN